MKKQHRTLSSPTSGVDYHSADFNRDSKFLKDALNIELGESDNVVGRRGFRNVLPGVWQGVTRYDYYDRFLDGNVSELLAFNGVFFKLVERFFSIRWTSQANASLQYQNDTLKLLTNFGDFSLGVRGQATSGLTFQDFWSALKANSSLISINKDPVGDLVFGKTLPSQNLDLSSADGVSIILDYSSGFEGFEVGRIFPSFCDTFNAYRNIMVVAASGLNAFTLKMANGGVHPFRIKEGTGGRGCLGISSFLAMSISRIEEEGEITKCYYLCPQVIPDVKTYKTAESQYSSISIPSLGSLFSYNSPVSFQSGSDSIYAIQQKYSSFLQPEPLGYGQTPSLASRGDMPTEIGRPIKYDGRRQYYAGVHPAQSLLVLSSTGGGLQSGVYRYCLQIVFKDARERVIYSEPVFKEVELGDPQDTVDITIGSFSGYDSSLGALAQSFGMHGIVSAASTSATQSVELNHGILVGDVVYHISGIQPKQATTQFTSGSLTELRVLSVTSDSVGFDKAVTTQQGDIFVVGYKMLICRTRVGGTRYYVVEEVPYFYSSLIQNSGSFNKYYRDIKADTALIEPFSPAEIGREGTVPPPTEAMVAHNGRMIYASGNTIFYSLPDANLESFEGVPRTNSISIGGRVGGRITALESQGDFLYVFREKGIYQINGAFEDAQGLPTLKQSVLTEFDVGAQTSLSVNRVGGIVCGFSNGQFYALFNGNIYFEVGKNIKPKHSRVFKSENCRIFWNEVGDQLYLVHFGQNEQGEDLYLWSVLDCKHFSGAIQQDSQVVFSRKIFQGAFFPWDILSRAYPSDGLVSYQNSLYYSSFIRTDGFYGIYKQNELSDFSDSSFIYQDEGLPIQNKITFSPEWGSSFEEFKNFIRLKFYRYFLESEEKYKTPWSAEVGLVYNLSNMLGNEKIVQSKGAFEFLNNQDSEKVIDISSVIATAVEITLENNKVFESLDLSRVGIEFSQEFITSDLKTR